MEQGGSSERPFLLVVIGVVLGCDHADHREMGAPLGVPIVHPRCADCSPYRWSRQRGGQRGPSWSPVWVEKLKPTDLLQIARRLGTSSGLPTGQETEVKISRAHFQTGLGDNFEPGFGLELGRSRASEVTAPLGDSLEFLLGKGSMERGSSPLWVLAGAQSMPSWMRFNWPRQIPSWTACRVIFCVTPVLNYMLFVM